MGPKASTAFCHVDIVTHLEPAKGSLISHGIMCFGHTLQVLIISAELSPSVLEPNLTEHSGGICSELNLNCLAQFCIKVNFT